MAHDDDDLATVLAQRITRCGSWKLELDNLDDLAANDVSWSDEVYRVLGYEPRAFPPSNDAFFGAVHPEDRPRILAAATAAITSDAPYALDHRVVHPDGTIRILHATAEIVRDPTGRPLRMVGTEQDVTEQRATETRLAVADRLASVGELAAGVAHEINNPLAAVSANLELLKRYLDPADTRSAECVRDACDATSRVQAIVRDLLLFAHVTDSPRQLFDLRTAIEAALRLVNHDLKHRARVVVELGDVCPIEASESRLVQVFLNLLRNAAQAIPEQAYDDHEVRITIEHDGQDRIIVVIADTGCGIPAQVRERVFTPFFTTKAAGTGTGLGLSICQRIVGELDGEITFTSEVGRGTTFRVAFPAAQRPAQRRAGAR